MLTLDTTLQIPAHVMFTTVDETAVLLNTQTNQYYSLDDVGAQFWNLLKSGNSLQKIYQTLLDEYKVASVELEQDLLELINHLLENGLVEII